MEGRDWRCIGAPPCGGFPQVTMIPLIMVLTVWLLSMTGAWRWGQVYYILIPD